LTRCLLCSFPVRIAQRGLFAPNGLKPIFATKTFPNFFSIATGLYEESHGIVDNQFFDPEWNATFSITDPISRSQSRWYEKGEPIWVTAARQGKKVGTFFWPGTDVPIHGVRPHFWRAYDSRIPFKTRTQTVMDWLRNEKVDLAMLYFNEPDHVAHYTGPFSEQTKEKVEQLDQMIGYLMGQLTSYGLLRSVNVVILSDHGMAGPAERNNSINLSDYLNLKRCIEMIPVTGSIAHIQPFQGQRCHSFSSLLSFFRSNRTDRALILTPTQIESSLSTIG
jgi:ectonucleotide pyrophosphatase/phosphodiesterase family protein 5